MDPMSPLAPVYAEVLVEPFAQSLAVDEVRGLSGRCVGSGSKLEVVMRAFDGSLVADHAVWYRMVSSPGM